MKPTLPTCLNRQMTTRLVLFSLLFLGLGQTKGFAQELFRYTNLTSGSGTVATHIAPASLTRGNPDIDPASDCLGDQGYGSHGWPTTNVFNVNTFNSNGWYVEFTLDPDPGYGLKVTGMTSRSRRENPAGTANDGPISIRYGYSTDGGANWTTVYPGNPQSSNLCASGGVNRAWPAWDDTLTSNPIIFRIYALSSGSARDGDLFLRDIVVNGVVCANAPTISPAPDFFEACYGETSVNYAYAAEEGDTYSIDYDHVNFVDVPAGTPLPGAPDTIAFAIPANTVAGSYTGTLTVANACGFSTDYGFTIQVNPLPDVSITVTPDTICAGDDVTLNFTHNGAPPAFFTIVADLVDDNGISVGEINFTGVPSGASVVYTEGVDFDGDVNGTVSLTNIVVTNETTGCVNDTIHDITVVVNPLPVVVITATDESGVANDMAVCTGGSATLTASGGVSYNWSTGATTAEITVNPVSSTTYTVEVTSADGCIATATKTVTVNPYPSASLSVVPAGSICPGTTIEVFFNESAWIGGTEFTIGADVSPSVFGFDTLTLYEVINGDHLDLIEGVDFTGDLAVTQVWVTEPVSGCSSPAYGITVDVLDAPTFEFSAASEGDGPHSGNNTTGPNTLDVDFCAGQHLTLSGYLDNGNVGYNYYYTTTGNVTYDGVLFPVSSGPNNIAFGSAATFFGTVYGGVLGYGLTTGTTGTINQIFVPYLDNDGSGTLTAGDCEGDTMFLNYHIFAVPTVDAIADIDACEGESVSVAFTGAVPGTTYNWTNSNTAIGLAASGSGDIPAFSVVNNTAGDLVATIVMTPVTNQCTGATDSFTITVHPIPTFGFSAGSDSDPAEAGNNTGGPTEIFVDFCAGDDLTLSGYTDNGAIGFIGSYTTSGNTTGAGNPLALGPVSFSIAPSGAAGFFNFTYPDYALASGTYGWIDQIFTPYLDVNGNDSYDVGIDCLGEPMLLHYKIYAPISLTITRNNPAEICSGDAVDYTFSTTSTQPVSFDLILEENSNGANPADLNDDNTLPDTLVGVTINDLNGYNFTQAINNAVGSFDRGRVRVRAINIIYIDADVCETTAVTGQNTQVYPKPILEAVEPLLSCNGSTLELDIDTLTYSINPGAAGFPLQIDWTLNAPNIDEDGATGSIVIYDNDGIELNGGIDIAQLLTLSNPLNGPQTATFTITPRASGPSNGFNGDDCYGDPITVVVTVVPAGEPTIYGPTCVHVGAEIQLTADNGVDSPAMFASGVWTSTPDVTLLDTFDLDSVLVTGYIAGDTATIIYTVTDNAGCVSTAEHQVAVLDPLLLQHIYTGGPVTCGEEFTVSVEVTNFCDINTLDYPFTWDPLAFQLVTFNPPTQIPGGTFDAFTGGPGQLYLSFYDDFNLPYGNDLDSGTVVLTYTLRAIGDAGTYNIPDVLPTAEAYNSGFYQVPVETEGVSIPIEGLTLDLLGNPVVCPSEGQAVLNFTNVTGNPTHYYIKFDGCDGFPSVQQGDLVVLDGEIIIPFIDTVYSGSCNAFLIVSDPLNGCESDSILFSIIIDQDPPTASNPAPVNVACIANIPAPNVNVVTDEDDNCPTSPLVAYEPSMTDTTGTGCAGNPMIITRVYSVTDEAGNTIFVTQTITALDDVAPTVSTILPSTWYPSGQAAIAAALAQANATKVDGNGCTPPVGINVALGAVDTAGCNSTIQLIVTDACGNLTPLPNSLYTVTIDREAPEAIGGVIDDCYDESENVNNPYYPYEFAVNAALLATSATDDCDAMVDITAVIATGSTDCNLTIFVIATDDCGKVDTVTYHTRAENDAPIISSNPLALDGVCFDTEAEALDSAIAITIAGDDCGNMLQYDAFANGGCPAEIMVVVTDFCGNPSTITYTGVHIDTEDPEVDPDAIYATCFKTLAEAYDSLAKAANPSDNCTALAELLASASGDTTEVGDLNDDCVEVNIEITFTDNCGNSIVTTFEFISIDNIVPTIEPLEDLEFACIDDVDLPNTLLVVANDNCEVADIVWLEDEESLPTECPGTGTRTYRVYDCAGNFTDVVQNITINDDVDPVWLTPVGDLNRTIDCEDFSSIDDALTLEPEGEDVNCGDVVVELVSSTPLNTCAGGYVRQWSVTDLCGNASTVLFTQTITIIDNVAPTWLTTATELNSEVSCSDPQSLADSLDVQPVADDVCGSVSYQMVDRYYEAYNECIDDNLGRWVTEWTATDDCGNTSTTYFHYVYVYDHTAPEWVTPEGAPYPTGLDATISCSDVAGYTFFNTLEPIAVDSCDFELDLIKIEGIFVPGGDCPGEGSFQNTWTAVDHCGNVSVVFTQTITVVDNTPPTFDPLCQFMPLNLFTSEAADCQQGISLEVGDSLDYLDSWTVAGQSIPSLGGCIADDCSPIESIIAEVVSITDVPGQTVIVNSEFTAECVRQITVSFQLSDACGNVQPTLFVCIYNIIDDTAPVVFCPYDMQSPIAGCYPSVAAAEAAVLADINPCDNCTDTDDLTIEVTTVGTCNAEISVVVKDCAGNVSDTVRYHTRIDSIAPVMTVSSIPSCYETVALAQAAAIAGTTITDNCSSYGELDITVTTTGTCPATVTVTATDSCGNSRSVAYSGLCIGASSEVVIAPEASSTNVDCDTWQDDLAAWLADHGGAEATDNDIQWSYSPLDPATVLQNSMASCTTHSKSVLVTFRATNDCGNFDETTATFTLTDLVPPTANPIQNVTLSCIADTTAPNVNFVTGESDNCGGTPTVTLFANTKMGTGCPGNPLIIARTYIVTDDFCNTASVTQVITVVDNVPPTFAAPANITINVNAGCVYNASTAITGDVLNESDNCTPSGPGLQAYYTDVVNVGVNNPDKYIITRTWQLIDACGNVAIPRIQTITVQDVTNPTITGCPANSSHTGGPVFDEVLYSCAWTSTGMTMPAFNDNCPGAVLSYHLDGFFAGLPDGIGSIDGVTFLEGTTTVTYTVTDEVGNTASCSFTVTVNCLTISGRIIWEHDDVSGVKNATVNATNVLPTPAFMGSDLSDMAGDYEISVPAAGTYKLTPVKNTGGNAGRMNGVDAADATRITNHVNFSNPITDPYKKVCADVNRSGIINTQDATLITQCIMGNPTAQAVFNVFWRFTPTDYIMPGTAHQNVPAFPEFKNVPIGALDVLGINFFGMKIGDVAAAWANPQSAPISPLVWVVQDQTLVAGSEVELSFAASNFNDLAAYQLALDFDPTQLQFVGFQALNAIPLSLLDNFGTYNADLGELRSVWTGGTGTTLADGTPVFRAKFKVLKSGQKLSEVLQLDDSEIPCQAYSEALVPTDMKLVFTQSVNTDTPLDLGNQQLQLLQNRPNPFSDATTIGFILPEACDAHIRILDISGRELTSYDRKYTAGYHELEFRMENAWSYGMLFCELVTPQGKRTIKMMTAK